MAKKPTKMKGTGEAVSAIAGRIMAAPDPFEHPDMRASVEKALKSINARIEDKEAPFVESEDITDQIIAAIRPHFADWIKDVRSVAASALSQDETK